MSNVDVDNGIVESPHPEADAGANFLDEGAEGQDRELQDGSGDDSVEEGTEAELEAEDEAGTHQNDRGLEVHRGNELDVADTDSEAEDHVIQEAERVGSEGGAGIEENEKSLTEDDSLGACGASMIEADIIAERSLIEADINCDVDNDNTEADFVESPGSDRTDIVATGGSSSQAVSDLTEADVGVITSVDGLHTEKCSEVASVKAEFQASDLSESDGNFEDLGGGSKQTDTTEVDLALLQATQSSCSEIAGDVSTVCSGTPQKNKCQELETEVVKKNETVKIVCDSEKDKLESSSGGATVRVLNDSQDHGVLEDEIGSVQCQGGGSLLVRPGLQHAESEESYEPECDQDSDEVRMSPHHNSQHNLYSDEVRMSPQCVSQNHDSDEIRKSDSTDSVYDSDVLLPPNNGVEQGNALQEAVPPNNGVEQGNALQEAIPPNNVREQGSVLQEDIPSNSGREHGSVLQEAMPPTSGGEQGNVLQEAMPSNSDGEQDNVLQEAMSPNNGGEQGSVLQEDMSNDMVKELSQNNSPQAGQRAVDQENSSPCVSLDSSDSSLATQLVLHQCSNFDLRNGSNKQSSPKTQTSSASTMAATISSSFLDSSSGNSNASSRQSSPARVQALPKSSPGQNCDIKTLGARSKCRELDPEDGDDLLEELESELTDKPGGVEDDMVGKGGVGMARVIAAECLLNINNPNGLVDTSGRLEAKVREQISNLQQQLQATKRQLQHREAENDMLRQESEDHQHHTEAVIKERDSYLHQLQQLKTKNPTDDLYLPQIKELEFTIAQQQGDIKSLKDKLTSHDTAAKRAITTLQSEMKLRVDQVTKMYEDANREKDSMVVKYAQSERNFLEVQKMKERLESKLREAAREREGFNNRAKDFKAERKRIGAEMESKVAEAQALAREIEKAKEALSSQEVRIKWAQNKLKAELEAHKDTKVVLEKTNMKLKEAKEETEQIRKDCQAIVKTYQESEEIKSNSLDHELKKKKSELLLQQQEKTDQEELHQATRQELDQLKKKHKDTISELQVLKENLSSLETKYQQSEQTGNKLKEMIQKQKRDNKELQDRVQELTSVEADFRRAQSTIKSLDAEISELKISNKDLLIDMDACRKRETEKLELTEKLSAKNAELQSENTLLHNRGIALSSDVERQRIELQSLETRVKDLTENLTREQAVRQQEVGELTTKLDEKSQAVEDLSRKVEDEKDEVKTLKRKHVNNIKDLTRQLQQTRRRLETFESNGERDTTSMGSRTSSNGSLNTACNTDSVNNSSVPPSVNNHVPSRHSSPPQEQPEYPVITEQVEPDRQLLIERIVKLQRSHARKNEKIEFMADHISQLVDQIQKKNKIIHSYALREESGTMTPEMMDYNKTEPGRSQTQAQFSKKHSIMASLYSSHQTDGTMTLDLSLEINRKLQAVLEDALLKNITLKESIDTLGEEISRLSQENRQLQLKSQAKKPAR